MLVRDAPESLPSPCQGPGKFKIYKEQIQKQFSVSQKIITLRM